MMFSSAIEIDTVRGTWSNERCQLGWIKLLLSSADPLQKNTRLITKLALPSVSEYLVGTRLVGSNKSKLKESTIIIRSLLIEERKEQIPQTIPNIKITSHNEKIVNIHLSILKIL